MKHFYQLLATASVLLLLAIQSQGQSVAKNDPTDLTPSVTDRIYTADVSGNIGIGLSPFIKGCPWQSLNLLGQGSLGGRLEETDYFELDNFLHFNPTNHQGKATALNFTASLAVSPANGQFIGNVSTGSLQGLSITLPQMYLEAQNIQSSPWSIWVGSRYLAESSINRFNYNFFDDHSSQGFGVTWNKTSFITLFPAYIDTTSSYPPYYVNNTILGDGNYAMRQRFVFIGEHTLSLPRNTKLKFLGEYHYMPQASAKAITFYKSDYGWVAGMRYDITFPNQVDSDSFNQIALRYGSGIANGGDDGDSKTWITYGALNPITKRFNGAYSFTVVDNFTYKYSDFLTLNAYGIYIKSKGGASTNNGKDYYGRTLFNKKTDCVIGLSTFLNFTQNFKLLNEIAYASRVDAGQAPARMVKLSIAPTFAPTGSNDQYVSPQYKLVFSVAHYNKFAQEESYSNYLEQAGSKSPWGMFIGLKAEL